MIAQDKLYMYFWLTSILQNRGPISLAKINTEWVKQTISHKEPMERNTFRKYLETIQAFFGINIEYCPSGYFITNPSALNAKNLRNHMLSNITDIKLLTNGKGLGDKLQVEDTPVGSCFHQDIVHALKNNLIITFTHTKFDDDSEKSITAEPYCLKGFKRRWYILVRDLDDDKVKTYALDRISQLACTNAKFKPKRNIDVSTYFDDCYGIYVDDTTPKEAIIVQTTDIQAKYMRTLPLHHSQKEVEPNRFRFRMHITPDFVNELFRLSPFLEVIEPEHLRDTLKKRAYDVWMKYENGEIK